MQHSIETYTYQTGKNGSPKPLGAYSHVAAYQDLIFVCGMGPRNPETNKVPGLILGPQNERLEYNTGLETQSTLENLKSILEKAGSSLEQVLEMNVYLVDMNDFEKMNQVYLRYFDKHRPVRTCVGVSALPGWISVEMKAVALRR